MLAPVTRAHDIELWSDTKIATGDDWERRIRDEIQRASFALLLISQDYFNSSFIQQVEFPAIVSHRIPVAWALVDYCVWESCEQLPRWQAVRDPLDKPLGDVSNVNKALAEACRSIRDDFLLGQKQPSAGQAPT
jgi:hypothetical protein